MSVTFSPIQPKFISTDEYVVFDKPVGLYARAQTRRSQGLAEILGSSLNRELVLLYDLESAASGCLILRDLDAKQHRLTEKPLLFTFHFVTLHSHPTPRFEVVESGMTTWCVLIQKNPSLNLWKLQTATADVAYVLSVAAKAGLTVRGDLKNGSDGWFRLGLHLSEVELKFGETKRNFRSSLPSSFMDHHPDLSAEFSDRWEILNSIYDFSANESFRLIHRSTLDVQADVYGEVLWVYWYKKDAPLERDILSIRRFCDSIGKKFFLRRMVNRGSGVGGREAELSVAGSSAPRTWTASENQVRYQLKQSAGFSPGLFLDQSENRRYIFETAKNKKLLNLFCYTAGFSVVAALGGASTVTSVDASRSFLEWGKENFRLNGLDPEAHEFFCQDVLLFLAGAKKRARAWDVIVCDPPSFGRTRATLWRIEKDLAELASAIWDCLSPNGELLFTCNYEKWTHEELVKNFSRTLPRNQFEMAELPPWRLDIELPDHDRNLTKGFILKKKK